MNGKMIGVLAIVTLIMGVVASQISQAPTSPQIQSNQLLYPQLLPVLKEVDEIQIKTKTSEVSLLKKSEQWGVKEKAQYPAMFDKIADVLNGMANLQLVEAKTDKAELYNKLDVEDISNEGAKSVQVVLKKNNDIVADLIIGKARPAKGDSLRSELYVRKANDKQSWVVLGNVNVGRQIHDWLDKQIAHIEENRVREVVINQATPIRIFREKSDDKDFQLANLPEKATTEQTNIKNIARFLAHLSLEDVMAANEFKGGENPFTAVFTTFDGLEMTVTFQTLDNKHYATLSAVAKPDLVTGEKREELLEKLQKEVEQLNQRLSNWVYIIPEHKVRALLQKPDALFKIPTEETPNSTVSKEKSNALETLENLGKH
ncbi:MAG: hypothetical protein RIT27_1753 [Pseudomonadota bacterium]|jgi:hypothetical protein